MKTMKVGWLGAVLLAGACAAEDADTDSIVLESQVFSEDIYVPHVSTVPANAGETVGMFVRHITNGSPTQGTVLFTSSGTISSVTSNDFDFQNYNIGRTLAQRGFDVYLMDQTGYGFSPHPTMDDPCNANPAQQNLLIPNPLAAPCPASYPFRLVNIGTEWPEIDSVVDYIRDTTGDDKVSLVGWSRGTPRMGGYSTLHPEKVERVAVWGPTYIRNAPATEPPAPSPYFSFTLSNLGGVFTQWFSQIRCEGTVDPEIRPAIEAAITAADPLAASWGNPTNNLRRVATDAQLNTRWNATMAAQVSVPFLINQGVHDLQAPNGPQLYADMTGTSEKILLRHECGTHYLHWEKNHRALLAALSEFLGAGTVNGASSGELSVSPDGEFSGP